MRIYVAKVHGEYIAQNGDERILKAYSATFRLPNADAPLGLIKGKLLMPFLRKLDPAAIAAYSWHLDEIAPENGAFDPDDLPVLFQNIAQLKEYCKRHKLAVPVEEYGNLETARQHVILAKQDPATFKAVFDKYQKTMTIDRELEDLNSGFVGIGESKGEVEVDADTGVARSKLAPDADTGVARSKLAPDAPINGKPKAKSAGRPPKVSAPVDDDETFFN